VDQDFKNLRRDQLGMLRQELYMLQVAIAGIYRVPAHDERGEPSSDNRPAFEAHRAVYRRLASARALASALAPTIRPARRCLEQLVLIDEIMGGEDLPEWLTYNSAPDAAVAVIRQNLELAYRRCYRPLQQLRAALQVSAERDVAAPQEATDVRVTLDQLASLSGASKSTLEKRGRWKGISRPQPKTPASGRRAAEFSYLELKSWVEACGLATRRMPVDGAAARRELDRLAEMSSWQGTAD